MTDNNLKITYKGTDIVDADISTETTKTLKTAGKYCEGDIVVTAQGGSGGQLKVLPTISENGKFIVDNTVGAVYDGTYNTKTDVTTTSINRYGFLFEATFKTSDDVITEQWIWGLPCGTANFYFGLKIANGKLYCYANYEQEIEVYNTDIEPNTTYNVYYDRNRSLSQTQREFVVNGTRVAIISNRYKSYVDGSFLYLGGNPYATGSNFKGTLYEFELWINADGDYSRDNTKIKAGFQDYYLINEITNQKFELEEIETTPSGYTGFQSPITVYFPPKPLLFGYDLDIWGGIDSNGTLNKPNFSLYASGIKFTGLKNITEYRMSSKFRSCTNVPDISFSDLTTIGQYGLDSFAYSASFLSDSEVTMPKLTSIGSYGMQNAFYGVTNMDYVDIGDSETTMTGSSYSFSNAFYNCGLKKGFQIKGLKSVTGTYCFNYAFYASSKKDFNANVIAEISDLETVNATSCFYYCFAYRGRTAGYKWNYLPKIKTINGNSACGYMMNYSSFVVPSTYPQKQHIITFPKLENIGNTTGYNIFTYAFASPAGAGWKYCWFPMLKQIGYANTSSYGNFNYAFNGTKVNDLYELCMPELESIVSSSTSSTASYSTFNYCRLLSKIWMPKLNNVTGTPNISANGMFRNCTQSGLEIHFGKENETYIKSLTGYASKFGATNATIYFDCINHITVNGTVYNRDGEHYITELPVKATSSSTITHPDDRYSWKDANGNIIYTLECWTPVVGDNVLDADDNVVGTIGAVS